MDCSAHVSAAATQCLARRMETIVPAILHARERGALEPEKIVHLDSARRKRGTGDFSAHPFVRHPNAIRFRQHLSGKTKILQKRFFKTASPHAEKGLLKPPFCIFMGFLWICLQIFNQHLRRREVIDRLHEERAKNMFPILHRTAKSTPA